MAEENDNSAYSVTLKGSGGHDQPWLVIRAATVEQLQDRLEAVTAGGVFATIGRAAQASKSEVALGSLGAEKIDESGNVKTAKEPKKAPARAKTKVPAAKATGATEEAPEEVSGEAEEASKKPAAKAPAKKKPATKKAPPAPAWKK